MPLTKEKAAAHEKELKYVEQWKSLPKADRVSLREWLRVKLDLPSDHRYLEGHATPTDPPQPIY